MEIATEKAFHRVVGSNIVADHPIPLSGGRKYDFKVLGWFLAPRLASHVIPKKLPMCSYPALVTPFRSTLPNRNFLPHLQWPAGHVVLEALPLHPVQHEGARLPLANLPKPAPFPHFLFLSAVPASCRTQCE